MRKVFVALLVLLLTSSAFGQSVSYATRKAAGVTVNVVTADLNSSKVKVVPALASGFCYEKNYTDESFSSIINRFKPVAAINGTFFDKYTLKPVGSIVFEGNLIHSGGIGSAFCIREDGSIEFKRVSGTNGRRVDWSGVEFALCSGPTLLIDGKNVVSPEAEGFRDPHVYARANRSALGVTAANKLLLVTMPGVTLQQEAKVMQELGAVNAINLDGGASSALYYRGKYPTQAGRKLTNVLLIYEDGKYPRDKMQYKDVWTVLGKQPNVPTPQSEPSNTPKQAISSANTSTTLDIKMYPNAKCEPVISAEGQWYMTATTGDSFEKVVEHFKKEVGDKGQFQVMNDGEKVAVCMLNQTKGAQMISITVEKENGKPKTFITILGKG